MASLYVCKFDYEMFKNVNKITKVSKAAKKVVFYLQKGSFPVVPNFSIFGVSSAKFLMN